MDATQLRMRKKLSDDRGGCVCLKFASPLVPARIYEPDSEIAAQLKVH
jgi:hypothetical protein